MNYITRLTSIAFLFLCIFLSSNAQGLSLSEAINKSLANNYQIQISGFNKEIASNNNSWGAAGLFPSISLNASARYTFNDNDATELKQLNYGPGVSLNWTIFSGFKVKISKSKFEQLQKLSEENYQLLVETSIQSTILAYYKVLLEKEKLNVLSEVMNLSRDRYKRSLTQKELGSALTYDVLQSQNAYLSDSSNFILQKLNFDNARRALNFVMAEPTANEYELTDEFQVNVQQFDFETVLTQMMNNNKNLQIKYISNQILAKDASLAKSNMFPSLSLSSGANFGTQEQTIKPNPKSKSDQWGYNLELRLNYILFNGGNIKRAVDNAKINIQIGSIELEKMKYELTNLLFTNYGLHEARKQLLALAGEQVKASKLNLEISDEKFKTGAINSFNYRDVQVAYLNSAYRKLEATYNLIGIQTEILQLTGNIVQSTAQ